MLAFALAAVCFGGKAFGAPGFEGTALDRNRDRIVDLRLPDTARPVAPDDEIAIPGPWRIVSTVKGVRTWQAVLPVRPRVLFFDQPPTGMELHRENELTGKKDKVVSETGFGAWDDPNTWDFSTRSVRVRRRIGLGPPAQGEYSVVYPDAVARENALDPGRSGLSGAEFVLRSMQVDDTTRHGLYLPAPARIVERVEIPTGHPVLELAPGLLPTEAGDTQTRSDVRLTVRIGNEDVWSGSLGLGVFPRQRVALDAWAGQAVEISFETEATPGAAFPYAFVADPIVYEPMEHPPRAILVFMDTVRRDHLELYGYDRPTMPKLAEWAKSAAVMDDTRSVAPWTLPSSRTILTGAQPERFDEVPSLARLFAEKGWVSAAVVGNVYLSSNSDMAGDWTLHRCINWPPAAIQVDRALEILAQEKDRPLFLELHFMDAHLPYGEPWRYHGLFAGPRPKELAADSFIRQEVMRAERAMGEPGKQYLRDRYDQNLRYMDDQIARVLESIGPDDLVVVLADHGEEFWDHGGFEHGHTLYDELLRVPLIVKGSSLPPGHYAAPTSLLDVAPTIAHWAGLEESSMSGMALDALAADDKPFEERPQAFGRPLYGGPAWGVMKDGTKYVSKAFDEHLFDLRADAHEKTDLLRMGADTGPWLGAMSAALGRPVYRVLRLVLNARDLAHGDVVVRLDLPGGVKAAWFGDAQRPAPVALVTDATSVVATWRHGSGNVRELYVAPSDSLVEGTKKLGFTVTSGKETVKVAVPQGNGWPPDPADDPGTLLQGKLRNLSVALGYGVAPDMGGSSVNAYTPEMAEALKALGYVDEDRAPTAPRQGPPVVAPDAASPDGSHPR